MVRINIFRCPLADAFRTSQGSAKPRVVQERTDLSAKNSGQHFLSSQKHTPYALVWGHPRAPAGLEQPRQKRVPWRPPRSQTDTPAGSKLDRTLELTERRGPAGSARASRDPPGAPRPGCPRGALLTCQARRHHGGQQQQQQQRDRRRGQPEAPVRAAAGHRSAAAISARLDQAAVGRAVLRPVAGRSDAEFGASLTFLSHEPGLFGAFRGEEASRGLEDNLRPVGSQSGKGGSFLTL